MKNRFSRSLTLFLLVYSLIATTLPAAAYGQVASRPVAVGSSSSNAYAAALQNIEDKLEAKRKELGIPGVSLVIVKDDQVIYMKGLGYKDFEKQVPVTADTQFGIGSATKAFTALTVLMAQDEGKLSLDDSPKKYLPYFHMYDPETDKNITIRDLLSHSSGLNRTDLAMVTGKLNRAELIEVAAQAKPTAKLREKFQYQNIMFVAAGETAATVEKSPWDKLVADRIFKPLGMTNSTLSIAQMEKAKDYSFGYDYNFDTKETRRLPYREIVPVAPAGSINSTARDMSQWLRFVLSGGTVNGKRLLSEKAFDEWTKPQMKIAGKSSYGLGWFIQDWNGMKVVQHGGNIDGFNSLVAMVPEKKLGFVLLTNVSASSLGSDLMPIVWQNILNTASKEASPAASPSGIDAYVGKYRLDAAKVDIEVKTDAGKLVMVVPGQPVYTLEPNGERQFKLAGAPDEYAVKFNPASGDVTEMYLQQPQGNFTLPRLKAETAATAAKPNSEAAKELVGLYSTPAGSGTVEVKASGDTVTFNIEGQQPYALVEKSKDSYSMSPLPDTYTVIAKRDTTGKISGVVVKQPEGEFEFKRKAAEDKPAITVDELMAKVIDALGGEANVRKLSTRVTEFDMDLENQGIRGYGVTYAKAPNKAASETTMTALGKTIATGWEYFDGTNGEEAYSFAPVEKFAGKSLEDAKLGADFYSALDWKTGYKKVEVTGTAKVGGEDAYVVSFEPEKATPYKEFYSTKTFLLLKREGVVTSSTSPQQIPYTITYSDYRDIDGVKLPFKTVNYSIANGNIVTTVKTVKQNVPVDDKIFAPRKLQ
jgi:CubicO group peptidase (beta-lactamase class C family)